ncbi:hypothetical protein [Dyadobacter luticola]|uniref:Uncharacterized protein n=1 Tax=Dyadobacter luticola TaxID=1979387 RepID=A0A5R9KWL3_9BACT|nr:hypothetical protein [Dyadobacter luticola]TLV00489.1 hypothetical protein FEN17_13455 [Dyadobacter luticola]
MKVQELHSKAIAAADIAFVKKFHGRLNEAKELFKEAFALEKAAAHSALKENMGEPTLSVLLKSAASLAINCDETKEAEKLICLALSGEPPIEIAEELRNLLEELYFQRHLQLQGISLKSTELQLVIAGRGVGYGMAKTELVFDRINTIEQLTFRTAERMLGKAFRRSGAVPKTIKLNFQPYLSVPRAASLAFTIRLGELSEQMTLEGFDPAVKVVENLVENIELVNSADFEKLKINIPDKTYYKNFVGLSKELAPDGNEVNLVGLTIARQGSLTDVQFTRTREDIRIQSFDDQPESDATVEDNVELTGRLFAADDEKGSIRLKVDGALNYSVIIPDGLSDIVKKYWGEQVKIKGVQVKPRAIKLSDIDPA